MNNPGLGLDYLPGLFSCFLRHFKALRPDVYAITIPNAKQCESQIDCPCYL